MNLKYILIFVSYISISCAYVYMFTPCYNFYPLMVSFDNNTMEYIIKINAKLNTTDILDVTLDAVGVVESKHCSMGERTNTSIPVLLETDVINNLYKFKLLNDSLKCIFIVRRKFGPAQPPYLLSFKINGEEKCKWPVRYDSKFITYLNEIGSGIEKPWSAAPDIYCGRPRKDTQYRSLITNGLTTTSGKWPWHAALFKGETGNMTYICGGTLVSKTFVLTAAHCVTKRIEILDPKLLKVVLGKFVLKDPEETSQTIDVSRVIVHEAFNHRKLNHDIALLKLNSEVSYNNFVQPACLWFDGVYDQLDSYEIVGTVVGWGMNEKDTLPEELHESTMPQVADLTCIRHDPIFYTIMLNGNRFCAGYANGTAACNGDSGGGFVVFVPDVKTPSFGYDPKNRPGAWYIKGIVSVALVRNNECICDPKAYPVFTDVSKYRRWILNNMSWY